MSRYIGPVETEIDHYRIYRSGLLEDSLTLLASVNSTYYLDENVSDGKIYYYRVSAVKGGIEGEKLIR